MQYMWLRMLISHILRLCKQTLFPFKTISEQRLKISKEEEEDCVDEEINDVTFCVELTVVVLLVKGKVEVLIAVVRL